VQFVDGDCEVREEWCQHALSFLASHEEVAVVFGRRGSDILSTPSIIGFAIKNGMDRLGRYKCVAATR
jgi:hypothetical protein